MMGRRCHLENSHKEGPNGNNDALHDVKVENVRAILARAPNLASIDLDEIEPDLSN